MKSHAGLWIDHRIAIIVTLSGKEEIVGKISSDIAEFIQDANAESDIHSEEDVRDRRQIQFLNNYYEEVVEALGDAGSILIMGPGEAKGELEAYLEKKGFKQRIAAIETADKMTDRQVAARVREYYESR